MISKGHQPRASAPETLTCEEVRDLLYLFVSNELEEEFQAVCNHLVSCANCRKAMTEHVKLAGALSKTVRLDELRYYSRNN